MNVDLVFRKTRQNDVMEVNCVVIEIRVEVVQRMLYDCVYIIVKLECSWKNAWLRPYHVPLGNPQAHRSPYTTMLD